MLKNNSIDLSIIYLLAHGNTMFFIDSAGVKIKKRD
ncbi:Uncharacterised protein [Yersinia intermedia]|uniref:Uncharacterized protein n=1 Tax=Yersinia intermedia TaxID=631 RepID=A0A0H5LWX7_YERIN|nr:Uncharacterised protein [Yersinia intermedia]